MPMPAYLSIEGKNQGLISAGAGTFDSIVNEWQQGHEDEIMVHEFKHAVITPRDPLSGAPTGSRLHEPFSFTCTLNKAVPLMYNALVSGEFMNKVELRWYRTQGAEQVHFFSTILEDALIVDIKTEMPHVKEPTKQEYTQLVEVQMTYRKISWEHISAGTSGADDWRAPRQAS